jgi:hypothetical protein
LTDDRESLVGEIQRLQKANRRWRIIAFVGFSSAVAVMPFFTVAINQGIQFFQKRERAAEFRRSREEIDVLLEHLRNESEVLERTKKEYQSRSK